MAITGQELHWSSNNLNYEAAFTLNNQQLTKSPQVLNNVINNINECMAHLLLNHNLIINLDLKSLIKLGEFNLHTYSKMRFLKKLGWKISVKFPHYYLAFSVKSP